MPRRSRKQKLTPAIVLGTMGLDAWMVEGLALHLGVTERELLAVLRSRECADHVMLRDGRVVRARWYALDDEKPYFACITGGRSSAPPWPMAMHPHHHHGAGA